MFGRVSFAIVIVLTNFEFGKCDDLWCYQCNTDLSYGHTRECNDPYVPSPYFDLVSCPRNESHHCLKSVIDYGDLLVTVRGCVESRKIPKYCEPEEKHFPGSSVTCFFCQDHACNDQKSMINISIKNMLFILTFFNLLSSQIIVTN